MPEQFEGDPPFLAVAVEGCDILIDAHDQADAVLEILVDEGDAVADAEVGAAGDLRWGAWPVGFDIGWCRAIFGRRLGLGSAGISSGAVAAANSAPPCPSANAVW